MGSHNPENKVENDTAGDGFSPSMRNFDLEESSPRMGGEAEALAGSWDGPQDPKNPRNWPKWKKMAIVCMISAIGLET